MESLSNRVAQLEPDIKNVQLTKDRIKGDKLYNTEFGLPKLNTFLVKSTYFHFSRY